MITFDVPDRNMCTVKRQSTTTPLQPLVMLNDPQYLEAARVLAKRVIYSENEDVELQIKRAFRLLTSRLPKPQELKSLKKLYLDEKKRFEDEPENMKHLLNMGAYKFNEGLMNSKVAALTVVNNIIMNFDPVYTKY